MRRFAETTRNWLRRARRWSANTWNAITNEGRSWEGQAAGDWAVLDQFASVEFPPAARKGRVGRLLGLHLRELRAYASVCAGVVGEIQRQGIGRDRHPHAGVHVCAL